MAAMFGLFIETPLNDPNLNSGLTNLSEESKMLEVVYPRLTICPSFHIPSKLKWSSPLIDFPPILTCSHCTQRFIKRHILVSLYTDVEVYNIDRFNQTPDRLQALFTQFNSVLSKFLDDPTSRNDTFIKVHDLADQYFTEVNMFVALFFRFQSHITLTRSARNDISALVSKVVIMIQDHYNFVLYWSPKYPRKYFVSNPLAYSFITAVSVKDHPKDRESMMVAFKGLKLPTIGFEYPDEVITSAYNIEREIDPKLGSIHLSDRFYG